MKDYQEIFNRWVHLTNEELSQFNEVGAYIELANRTNDPAMINKALLSMDFDTYNAISALKFLKGDGFAEKLKTYDAILIPLITTGRTLNVLYDSDVLLYCINTVKDCCDGYLKRITETLLVLTYKVVDQTSKTYTSLLSFGYSAVEIAYLNYTWLRQNVGQGILKKLQCNLLSSMFELPQDFTELHKRIIEDVLAIHDYKVSSKAWTAGFMCNRVENDENWKWLYSLVDADKLHLKCIQPHPILSYDTERFCCLTYPEKIMCMDYDIASVDHKLRVEDTLTRVQFREYLESFNREIPTETATKLVKLGYIDFDDVSESQKDLILNGVNNKVSFSIFMNNPAYQSVKYLKQPYSMTLNCRRDFLSESEQRDFISKVLEISFNTDYNCFLQTLCGVLMDAKLTELYDNALLISIVDCIRETLNSRVTFNIINKMLKNVLPDEEYRQYELAEKELQERNRLREKTEATAKRVEEMQQRFNAVQTPKELIDTYEYYIRIKYLYDEETIKSFMLSSATDKFFIQDDCVCDGDTLKLYYLLWDIGLISLEEFRSVVNFKEVA